MESVFNFLMWCGLVSLTISGSILMWALTKYYWGKE